MRVGVVLNDLCILQVIIKKAAIIKMVAAFFLC